MNLEMRGVGEEVSGSKCPSSHNRKGYYRGVGVASREVGGMHKMPVRHENWLATRR